MKINSRVTLRLAQSIHPLITAVTLVVVWVSINPLNAQELSKIYFETEFTTKYSVGEEVTKAIQYDPGFTINYPSRSTLINPLYALEFGPTMSVKNHLRLGLLGGLAVAQNEKHPLVANQYFNRIIFPVNLNVGYKFNLNEKVFLIPKAKLGYQFLLSQFVSTAEGFLYEQSGGLMMAIGLDCSIRAGKYFPTLSIGYEISTIHNDVSLGWIDGYAYSDQYEFNTNYHFITIGVGVKY